MCPGLCVSVYSPCQGNSGGRAERWGALLYGLLKEINGLQMAQSIYSNETWSLAMTIEQRDGGGG